jgi:hypothetical protein
VHREERKGEMVMGDKYDDEDWSDSLHGNSLAKVRSRYM